MHWRSTMNCIASAPAGANYREGCIGVSSQNGSFAPEESNMGKRHAGVGGGVPELALLYASMCPHPFSPIWWLDNVMTRQCLFQNHDYVQKLVIGVDTASGIWCCMEHVADLTSPTLASQNQIVRERTVNRSQRKGTQSRYWSFIGCYQNRILPCFLCHQPPALGQGNQW